MVGASKTGRHAGGASSRFQLTVWSQVVQAAARDPFDSDHALDQLCNAYRRPVFHFIRHYRPSWTREQAEDLTQSFFCYFIANNLPASADPSKGRFRSFLLGSVKHFLSNELQRSQAQKRGGAAELVSLDLTQENGHICHLPASSWSPDQEYDHQWALAVLEETRRLVQTEYQLAGRQEEFEVLRHFLADAGSYADAARALRKTEGACRVAVTRFRHLYASKVREVIAATLSDLSHVDEELAHLKAALRPP